MDEKVKKQTGITLIALIITIIVLLILVGVTIATLTGENGILTRANDSKKQTEIASVKEQAQLDIANWIAERLENGEDTTLDDATIKNIIETANASNTDKYYKELQSDKIITQNGYEILYSEFYQNEENELEIGDYVNYNVSYTDMYSRYNFTASDGWRILDLNGIDDDGTLVIKIISTGIPVKVNYDSNSILSSTWSGNSTQRINYATKFYSSNSNDNENMYAASGLYYNFQSINFTNTTAPTKNNGGFLNINNNTDNTTGNIFLSGSATSVHALTGEEVNKARNKKIENDSEFELVDNGNESSFSTQITMENDPATGLFYLRNLNKFNYSTDALPYYWLASPVFEGKLSMWMINYEGAMSGGSQNTSGVRVVVSIPKSQFKLTKVIP